MTWCKQSNLAFMIDTKLPAMTLSQIATNFLFTKWWKNSDINCWLYLIFLSTKLFEFYPNQPTIMILFISIGSKRYFCRHTAESVNIAESTNIANTFYQKTFDYIKPPSVMCLKMLKLIQSSTVESLGGHIHKLYIIMT